MLVNLYPRLAVRLAEVTGEECPPYERLAAGPNTHQVRRDGKRGQVASDATVHLMRGEEKCHFFQVEMQRDYKWSKLATLRAYHGSEVRNAGCGGHVFVLSPRASVTGRFRRAEDEARARLAFSVSYLTGQDLEPLAVAGGPFEERALAAAMTDFSGGLTAGTVPMLLEMQEQNETMADLFFRAILEECPDESELEEELSDLAMRRLESLPSFQRWAAGKIERMRQDIERDAERKIAAAQAKTAIQSLLDYFTVKGDAPTSGALEAMNACTNPTAAQSWLKRAFAGETSAQIFPDAPDLSTK